MSDQNGTKKLNLFSELQIGSKFKMGECVGVKTQEGVTLEVCFFGKVKLQPFKFNFVHLGPNRGTLGWLSGDQCVEVIAPHLEGS